MSNRVKFNNKDIRRMKKEDMVIGKEVLCTHSSIDKQYYLEKIISLDSKAHFSTRKKGKSEHHYSDCKIIID